jgi:hypothetical protein
MSAIADASAAAFMPPADSNLPQIRTFLVGIGPSMIKLDQIAAKAGTGQAFLIEEGDVAAQLVDALKNIALFETSCKFSLPESSDPNQILDLTKVRILYWPDGRGTGDVEEVPHVERYSDCFGAASGGWYYDSPDAPTAIVVCPCTCVRIRTGFVDVQPECVW